jgi:pectin methylesterase-like acyl-CoA thioesterase
MLPSDMLSGIMAMSVNYVPKNDRGKTMNSMKTLTIVAFLCTTLNACVISIEGTSDSDELKEITFNKSGELYVDVDSSYEYDFILAGNENIVNLNGSINSLIIKGDLNQINITEDDQLKSITVYGDGNDIYENGVKVFAKDIELPGNNNTLYITEYHTLKDTGWNNNVDGIEVYRN